MSRPLIGITTYPANAGGRFDLPTAYVEAVRRAGADVVLLPPGADDPAVLVQRLDGIVLSGGGDIDPGLYGGQGHETIYGTDFARDSNEIELSRWIIDTHFPALAICRGMQVMNVALGGTLNHHLPEIVGTDVAHRIEPAELRGQPGPTPHVVQVRQSRLARVLATSEPVPMSWHHQAVVTLGAGMRVVGEALDGTVEAIEHETHRDLLCVQWHPELTAADDPSQQRLFDALVASALDRTAR